MGLKQLTGSRSNDDLVLVSRTCRPKFKLRPQRRGRESLSATVTTVTLGRDELLLQRKEIIVCDSACREH